MDDRVALSVEDPGWEALDLPTLLPRALDAALAGAGLHGHWEISVLACSDARMAALNAQFRGKDTPTNVLSWPSEDRAPDHPGARPAPPDTDDPELGDLALAYGTCAREAAEAGIALKDHVTHLVVHGVLHLLGYDHETDADAELMERIEIETLARLGMANPYCVDGAGTPGFGQD